LDLSVNMHGARPDAAHGAAPTAGLRPFAPAFVRFRGPQGPGSESPPPRIAGIPAPGAPPRRMRDMRRPVRGTIASAISEARASLKDPSRPFTPAAMTRNRALFFEAPEARDLERRRSSARAAADARSPRAAEPRGAGRGEGDAPSEPAAAEAAGADEAALAALAEEVRAAARDRAAGARGRCEAALAPWHAAQTFNAFPASAGRRAALDALVLGLSHEDAATRLVFAREIYRVVDGSADPSAAGAEAAAAEAAFAASRSPKHDGLFFDLGVVAVLLAALARAAQRLAPARRAADRAAQRASPPAAPPLVFAAGALKNLTNDAARLPTLGAQGAVGTLCDVCRAAVAAAAAAARRASRRAADGAAPGGGGGGGGGDARRRGALAKLLVQVTGALRNLCAHRSALRPLEAARSGEVKGRGRFRSRLKRGRERRGRRERIPTWRRRRRRG